MEQLLTLLIPALLAVILVRLLLIPMRLIWKLGLHVLFGLLCLWLLNTVAPFTGIRFPINLVTTLIAGAGGLPGIAVLALLTIF